VSLEVWRRVDQELDRINKPWRWLAQQIGETEQTVNNWKRRGIPPSRHEAIAEALDWSIDYLIGRIDIDKWPSGLEHAMNGDMLDFSVGFLAGLMTNADAATRAAASPLLARIASNPEEGDRIAAILQAMTETKENKHDAV
jgi:hypothetical protein